MTGSTPRGAATKERIVAAAAALFHAQGVAATGLDEVLAATGTGKSQLYHHFGGKTGLVDDVIDVQAGRIAAWHAELLDGVEDVAGLRRWADAVVEAVAARSGVHGCPLGSLAAELSDRSDAHRDRVAAGFARWEQVLGAATARALGEGPDAATAAAQLLTALQGGLLLAEATRETRHLRTAFDLVLADVERRASLAGNRPLPRRRPSRSAVHTGGSPRGPSAVPQRG